MKRLQLPPTVRIARADEVPNDPAILSKIAEAQAANIVEGYVFKLNEEHDLPFKFYAEINIDNRRLWLLFKYPFMQLPQEICLVFNHKDDEPKFYNRII